MPRMSTDGTVWRHVILHTRGDWLHGDPRGFRGRAHRLHSSGDYITPPPAEEHAGLRDWYRDRIVAATPSLSSDLRAEVLDAFLDKLRRLGFPVDAVSVGARHVHVVALLPLDTVEVKREVGKCKQQASHRVRDRLPGSIWAEGGAYKPCWTEGHRAAARKYVLDHLLEGAAVWSPENGVQVPGSVPRPEEPGSSPSAQTPACSDPSSDNGNQGALHSTEQAGV